MLTFLLWFGLYLAGALITLVALALLERFDILNYADMHDAPLLIVLWPITALAGLCGFISIPFVMLYKKIAGRD